MNMHKCTLFYYMAKRTATATNFLFTHGNEAMYKSIRLDKGPVSVSGVILPWLAFPG